MGTTDFKKVISAAELVKLQWRPHGWLLWQMVPQGGITLLAGETASGKSLLGLDLALGLAAGRGRAWDMEIADSHTRPLRGEHRWLIADREKTAVDRPCTERTPAVPEEAVRVQNDAHLMRNGTSHIPYREKKTAPSSQPPACPGSGANRDHNEAKKAERPVSCLPCERVPYKKARVRYFCGDADPNLIAERVLRLCRGYPNGKKGMGIDVPDALDLDFTAHQFSDPQSFAWLAKEVVRQGYQLLIFDGLAQYLPGMADGSAPTVGAFLRGVRQLTSQTGVSVLLIHQFNKRQAARLDKWGLPTSQGEERIRGSSELLAGVDSVLLLSRPDSIALGAKGRALLKVVKNRLGQAGARLQFTIVDGDQSLHLLFERLARQAQPKPRRLVDAALDEMMRILMEQDQRKFDRAELTKLLQQRMNLPGSRTLAEAFGMLGKEEKVRVEKKVNGRRIYSWAAPGTGEMEKLTYGLPPIMAFDLGSKYLWSKTQQLILRAEVEKVEGKDKNSELVEKLAAFVKEQEEKQKKADSS